MKLRDIPKKLMMGGVVTAASVGLSSCNCNGAVDPAPPPLTCSAVTSGQDLSATGTISGTTLTITLISSSVYPPPAWTTLPQITSESVDLVLKKAEFVKEPTQLPNSSAVVIEFELKNNIQQAQFLLQGEVQDLYNSKIKCSVTRRFVIKLEANDKVQITQAPPQALQTYGSATIQVIERNGFQVTLSAEEAEDSAQWSVTDGTLTSQEGPQVTWTLPSTPGFYLVELVVDRGPKGFTFDTLSLEVNEPPSNS